MFIVVYGRKIRSEPLGWVALECPRCQQVQPFLYSQLVQTNHVYFVDYSEGHCGVACTCDFCGTSQSSNGQVGHYAANWIPQDGLQSLVDQTNPSLGRIDHPPRRTPTELHALLASISERSRALAARIELGMFAGIPGAILGFAAGYACRSTFGVESIDALGCGFIGAAAGGLIFTIGGAMAVAIYKSRKTLRLLVAESIARHKLDVGELHAVAARSPDVPGQLVRMLRSLKR